MTGFKNDFARWLWEKPEDAKAGVDGTVAGGPPSIDAPPDQARVENEGVLPSPDRESHAIAERATP